MSDKIVGVASISYTKPEFLFRLCTSFAPGDLIVAIRPDGSVEFGPGYTTLDEASRRFWEHIGRLPMKLAEAEAENAAWRKATGYSDPEALDFYLGRAGLPAHEKVWTEMLEKRAAEVERLEQQTDWYQQRFNRLRKWVKEEVEPLSEEVAHRYFSICANGSPAPHESADWTDTMHGLRLRADQMEYRAKEAHDALEAICHEFESTVAHADWRTNGSSGMSVPFHGDFASVVQLPSVISRMRAWVRTFRRALGREP